MDICLISVGFLILGWGLSMAASFASTSLIQDPSSVRLRALDPFPFAIAMVVACLMSVGLVWLSPFAKATCYAISASCFLIALGFRIQLEVRAESASLRRFVLGFIPWRSVSLTSPHASFDACPFSGENWLWIGGEEFQIAWWGLPEPRMEARATEFNAAVRVIRVAMPNAT